MPRDMAPRTASGAPDPAGPSAQMEEEGVPSTALREVSLLQMLSESNHVVKLLSVEHIEEAGKPMLYLVRPFGRCPLATGPMSMPLGPADWFGSGPASPWAMEEEEADPRHGCCHPSAIRQLVVVTAADSLLVPPAAAAAVLILLLLLVVVVAAGVRVPDDGPEEVDGPKRQGLAVPSAQECRQGAAKNTHVSIHPFSPCVTRKRPSVCLSCPSICLLPCLLPCRLPLLPPLLPPPLPLMPPAHSLPPPLPLPLQSMTYQLIKGVAHCHKHGVMHRDLK